MTRSAAATVLVERDLSVPMRDGVCLATDVYRPAASNGEPRPVLLRRTPYDKTERPGEPSWARMFAEHGYIAVVQDCRGCYASEGAVDFLYPEADDGFDTVAWIRSQPWCDERVATWGASWEGWAQTALAAAGAQGIAAMIPVTSGSDGWSSSIRHGGSLELRWLAWAYGHAAVNRNERRDGAGWRTTALVDGPPFSAWLQRWPLRTTDTQLAVRPDYERWTTDLLEYPSEAAQRHPSVNPTAHMKTFTDSPVLLVGGWYDSYARGTLELFERLSATKRGPIKVIVGPWRHGGIGHADAGDVAFGPAATLDLRALHLWWFDRWLGATHDAEASPGVASVADPDAPVNIFVMGGGEAIKDSDGRIQHGGRWRAESEWPLARARVTSFYLHGADGAAQGGLQNTPPVVQTWSTTYRFDPLNPVPTIGGNISALSELVPAGAQDRMQQEPDATPQMRDVVVPGGFDQREAPGVFGSAPPFLPLSSRPDVLVFQTAPLDVPIEVTGPIEARIWVASSTMDTDITAKLVDVYPPAEDYPLGYALNLTDSILRLRFRDGSYISSPLTPGVPVEARIVLYPTSNHFAAGHRIRLDISSSNYPRFDINPNTGTAPWVDQRRLQADVTILHDASHPSRLLLPVIPPPSRAQ